MNTDKMNIPIHRSFLGKLLLFMLLIGILPVLINAVVSYILAQNALNTATRETQKIIEADQSTYLLSWANERTQDIGTLAGIARISSMDPVTANEAIKQYFRYWGMYETIFLAGPDGKTIATSDDKPLDVSDRLYFSEALSGSVTLSEPLLSKASGHLVIVFASPVRSKSGDIVGVIGETVPLDTLGQLLDKNRSGLTSESYLVNQQGYFVTAPRFVNEMKAAGLITDRAELEYQLQTNASKELQAGLVRMREGCGGGAKRLTTAGSDEANSRTRNSPTRPLRKSSRSRRTSPHAISRPRGDRSSRVPIRTPTCATWSIILWPTMTPERPRRAMPCVPGMPAPSAINAQASRKARET